MIFVKITTKHASYILVTFVTHKRFAVLFFLPSCCLISQDHDKTRKLYPCHVRHAQAICLPLLPAVLLPKLTIAKAADYDYIYEYML